MTTRPRAPRPPSGILMGWAPPLPRPGSRWGPNSSASLAGTKESGASGTCLNNRSPPEVSDFRDRFSLFLSSLSSFSFFFLVSLLYLRNLAIYIYIFNFFFFCSLLQHVHLCW